MNRLFLCTVLACTLVAGQSALAEQSRTRAASDALTRGIQIAGDAPGEIVSRGLPLEVSTTSGTLELIVERVGVTPSGRKTISARNGTDRVWMVSTDDGWKGRLRSSGDSYTVEGKLKSLRGRYIEVDAVGDDRPLRPSPRASSLSQTEGNTDVPTAASQAFGQGNSPNLIQRDFLRPSIIDMVVYREEGFSSDDVALHVLFANEVFVESNIPITLRVTREIVVSATDGTSNDILDDASFQEGPFRGAGRPNDFGASIGAIFVKTFDDAADGICGRAMRGFFRDTRTDTPIYLRNQFSVQRSNCQIEVLAHEVGHNLGLLHNASEKDATLLYQYGVGFDGTIMAGFDWLLFSNPRLNKCGGPCGVPQSDSQFSADAADALTRAAVVMAEQGDPYKFGMHQHAMSGIKCRPFVPSDSNGLQWRERGLANTGSAAVDVICPLRRISAMSTGEDAPAFFEASVVLVPENTSAVETVASCQLREALGPLTYAISEAALEMNSLADSSYRLTFPRAKPKEQWLSSYTVTCRLPAGTVLQQLSTTYVF